MVFSLDPGSSLALRWMMLEKVLRVGASRRLAILGCQAFPSERLRWRASLPFASSYYLWMSVWRVESSVQKGSSLLDCQAFIWRSRFPVGPYVVWFNLPTWGGVGFIPSLSEGEEAPEAVYPALVEKVLVMGNLLAKSTRCLWICPVGWGRWSRPKTHDPGSPRVLSDVARSWV
jgi:hypothetical protein